MAKEMTGQIVTNDFNLFRSYLSIIELL
jgi:uncharacterized protein YacL